MSTYDLGPLVNNTWHQYSNSAGQVYYVLIATGESQFSIPQGWEDQLVDNWARDNSRTWPQWRNQRTGRIVLQDPNPPPPQTYLDLINVDTHLRTLERIPDSPEALYRRPMGGILRWLFPEAQGYDVVQEDLAGDGQPDFTVFKIVCRPGGSNHSWTFCIVESKTAGAPWGATEDQCHDYCAADGNDTQQAYAIVHIGLEVRFYKYQQGNFEHLSGKLHLRNDVQLVTQWADYVKGNPLSFV